MHQTPGSAGAVVPHPVVECRCLHVRNSKYVIEVRKIADLRHSSIVTRDLPEHLMIQAQPRTTLRICVNPPSKLFFPSCGQSHTVILRMSLNGAYEMLFCWHFSGTKQIPVLL